MEPRHETYTPTAGRPRFTGVYNPTLQPAVGLDGLGLGQTDLATQAGSLLAHATRVALVELPFGRAKHAVRPLPVQHVTVVLRIRGRYLDQLLIGGLCVGPTALARAQALLDIGHRHDAASLACHHDSSLSVVARDWAL